MSTHGYNQHKRLPPLQRLVSLIKERKVKTFSELCDELNLSPSKTHDLMLKAQGQGYAVDVAGDTVGIRPSQPSSEVTPIRISPVKDSGMFAVASDLHFGSKYHLRANLVDFIETAYERAKGKLTVLLPGDDLDGCYPHGKWELTHHGFDEQANDFREGLPCKKGLRYFGISGNHDETFERDCGMVAYRAIEDHFRANGRNDLKMLGARGAYLQLVGPAGGRGVFIQLWHPLKGSGYALSYQLQKHVEGYAPGQKPDMCFAGHWHHAVYFMSRGVHLFSCGTFQGGGSAFSNALGGAPTIGGWIVNYQTTEQGALRSVQPEWRGYQEVEEVRKVSLG